MQNFLNYQDENSKSFNYIRLYSNSLYLNFWSFRVGLTLIRSSQLHLIKATSVSFLHISAWNLPSANIAHKKKIIVILLPTPVHTLKYWRYIHYVAPLHVWCFYCNNIHLMCFGVSRVCNSANYCSFSLKKILYGLSVEKRKKRFTMSTVLF